MRIRRKDEGVVLCCGLSLALGVTESVEVVTEEAESQIQSRIFSPAGSALSIGVNGPTSASAEL